MQFDRKKPYNELPRLPPRKELETRKVLKSCIEANKALAELKAAGNLIPNQTILINTIPLLEAQGSSEIENIVTTTDKIFQHANVHEENADQATKETLRYRSALYEGFKALKEKPICTNTAVTICSAIKGHQMDVRNSPGTALVNGITKETIYTPPQGETLLREMLANWEVFLNEETELDPLVRMAVGHYQFEAIHPFTDGNGRTGRILNLLYLLQQKLLVLPVLYLSRYIMHNRSDYYRLLQEVTNNEAWEEWMLYMLSAVTETARWTTTKIESVKTSLEETSNLVKTKRNSIYTRELIELLFVQPYCRIQYLVDAGLAKRQTASTYLAQLVELGVLEELQIGREKLFINRNLMKILRT